jgi:hypothetical protein
MDAARPEPSEAGCLSCPGSRVIDRREREHHGAGMSTAGAAEATAAAGAAVAPKTADRSSALRQWPVQIKLVPPFAPYLENADLLIAADCVPFACADFHNRLLKDKILLVGCPKLDDAAHYTEKLSQIFKDNDVRSITIAHMEVPCCFGLGKIVESALRASGKDIPIDDVNVSIKGEVL